MLTRINSGALRRAAVVLWALALAMLSVVPSVQARSLAAAAGGPPPCHKAALALQHAGHAHAGAAHGDYEAAARDDDRSNGGEAVRRLRGIAQCCVSGCGILVMPPAIGISIAEARGARLPVAADFSAEGIATSGPARPPRTTDIADRPA